MAFVSGLVVGAIIGFIAGMFAVAFCVAGSDRDEHEIRRTGGHE